MGSEYIYSGLQSLKTFTSHVFFFPHATGGCAFIITKDVSNQGNRESTIKEIKGIPKMRKQRTVIKEI